MKAILRRLRPAHLGRRIQLGWFHPRWAGHRRALLIASAQLGLGACAYRPKPELTYRPTPVSMPAARLARVFRYPRCMGGRARPRSQAFEFVPAVGGAVVISSGALGPIFGRAVLYGYDYDCVAERCRDAVLERAAASAAVGDGFAPPHELAEPARGRIRFSGKRSSGICPLRDRQAILQPPK